MNVFFFGPPDVAKLKAKRDVKGLIKALRYENRGEYYMRIRIRRDAAEALGQIGDRRAVEPLIAAMKDHDREVRGAVVEALGRIGDARGAELLIAALASNDRKPILETLVRIGTPAVEPLIAALRVKEGGVREAAADALCQIGDKRAEEPFIAALRDESWRMRWTAAKALGQCGGASAVEPLIAILRGEDWRVRGAAAKALGQIGDITAVEPLIIALRDEDSGVRRSAAEALRTIGWHPGMDEDKVAYWIAGGEWDRCVAIGTPAVEPLIAALQDENSWVRRAAADALGRIGDTSAVEPLITAFQNQSEYVSRYVARTLARIDDPSQEESIIAVEREGARDVRKAVAKALGQIADARAVEPLITALDKDLDVLQAVAQALVDMYRSGALDDRSKQRILAAREKISRPHVDYYWGDLPSDCSGASHTDYGPGVAF